MPYRNDGPPAGDEYVYIPQAYDNDKSADPVRVTLRVPTEAQKRAVYGQMRAAVKLNDAGKPVLGADGKPEVTVDLNADETWRREALRQCVVQVEGYERPGVGDSWLPVVTADDFIMHARELFFYEVSTMALGGYALGDAKKNGSPRPSVSSLPSTHPSNGAAASAELSSSAASAAALAQQTQASASSPN